MNFGLEALNETVDRHAEGCYRKLPDKSLMFSQKTTDLKSSMMSGNRSRAITSEEGKLFAFNSGLKKSYGAESSNDSISKADKIKERLRASRMESAKKDDQIFEGISLAQSIYMPEKSELNFSLKKGLST